MSTNGRVTAEIDRVDLGDEEPVQFTYEYPYVSTKGGTNTVTHEPIGEEPVYQSLGPADMTVEMSGGCYLDEANFIDSLSRHAEILVRTDRGSWRGLVQDTWTDPTGQGGGERPGVQNRLYEYRLKFSVINVITDRVSR